MGRRCGRQGGVALGGRDREERAEGWAERGWRGGAERHKGAPSDKGPFLLRFLCRKHMLSDAGSSWVKDTL